MDLSNLRSRIETIKSRSSETGQKHTEEKSLPDISSVLKEHGWSRVDEMVFEKKTVLKNILPEAVSDILINPESVDTASSRISKPYAAADFTFYDTETTGLSAGAGNIVFLAGFGMTGSDGEFEITQVFLSDFPGEPAFLKKILEYIDPNRIYVSYNGRAFDSNVLKSRFALNGIRADFGYQLDLLYPSRRLWKNLIGGCSLSDIETRVLDKHRIIDVPGALIPDLYFDFIRSGSWSLMDGVVSHHLEDIASLAELLALQEQLFTEAEFPPDTGPGAGTSLEFADQLGLAALLLDKRPAAAESVLLRAYKSGNFSAGAMLSLQLKKHGRWEDACLLWSELWEASASIFAGTELAKYYEHRKHDNETALGITVEMLGLERFRIRNHLEELRRRRKRLEVKIGRS